MAYIPAVQSARERSTPIIIFAEEMTFRIRAMRIVRLMAKLDENVNFVVLLTRFLKSLSPGLFLTDKAMRTQNMNCKYRDPDLHTGAVSLQIETKVNTPVPATSLFREKYVSHNARCDSVKLVAMITYVSSGIGMRNHEVLSIHGYERHTHSEIHSQSLDPQSRENGFAGF